MASHPDTWPPETTWLVAQGYEGGWHTAAVFDDRPAAVEWLRRRSRTVPQFEYQLVRQTTTYATEETSR